jgi:hypothetical protein
VLTTPPHGFEEVRMYFGLRNKRMVVGFFFLYKVKTHFSYKLDEVCDIMSKEDIVNELFKPVIKKFPRRHVTITGLSDYVQMDLFDMQSVAKSNRGFRYVLIAINTFSKMVYCEPVKNKTAAEVASATEIILKRSQTKFKFCSTDNGSEFKQRFIDVLNKNGIIHFYNYNKTKAQIVERCIRTIKTMIYKTMLLKGGHNWVDNLQSVVDKYNSSYHSKIKMSPKEVNKKNEKTLLETVYNEPSRSVKPKYKVGDIVRLASKRFVFTRGFHPSWSTELFRIHAVRKKYPVTYILSNVDGDEVIRGGYYEQEIQKTAHPDVYLIEKILQRKNNMVKVRYLGLSPENDEWINKTDLL